MLHLTRWSPMRELGTLQRDIDEMFGRLLTRGEFGLPHINWEKGYGMPAVECARKGDNVVVRAELPGIDPKDIDITVTGNALTIKGERTMDKEVNEQDYYMKEIGYGTFERTVTLPEGVDAEKVKAVFNNGIIEVTMPVVETVKAHKVEIEHHPETPKKLKAA